MENHPDRRDSPRIPVGPDYTVQFQAKGHGFREVRLTNLSLGGCFAVVGGSNAGLFRQGAVLEQLVLEHPSFPKSSFAGSITYAMGTSETAAPAAFLGLGIHFEEMPEDVFQSLHAFVEKSLGKPWPTEA